MATVPQALVDSLQGVPGFNEAAFRHVHEFGAQVTSIRINPGKWPQSTPATIAKAFGPLHAPLVVAPVPWSQYGYYVAPRPPFTFDPQFHAGCYYVQEASSLFLEQALLQSIDLSKPLKVLDLCAAPGGKSTHLQSLLSADSLLVSNDVIRSRAAILRQNIIKWGGENVVVTNNDPQHFAQLEGFFDVIVVDAPCSGSGLFRRDSEAIAEWSPDNVQLCCGRQKRIVADVFPALKEGGLLIYSTCSYSKEEDEDIGDWMFANLHVESVWVTLQHDWHIIETESEKHKTFGYRFFPDKVSGEGFYLSVFKKTAETGASRLKEARLEKPTAAEKTVIQKWLTDDSRELFRIPYVYGLLKKFVPDYAVLRNYLNIQYAGIAIGEVMRDKLVPEHALALSSIVSQTVPVTEVDYDTAIQYLQRRDIFMETKTKGWQLIAYEGHNVGWINALQNRTNNYYPKDWRILRDRPD